MRYSTTRGTRSVDNDIALSLGDHAWTAPCRNAPGRYCSKISSNTALVRGALLKPIGGCINNVLILRLSCIKLTSDKENRHRRSAPALKRVDTIAPTPSLPACDAQQQFRNLPLRNKYDGQASATNSGVKLYRPTRNRLTICSSYLNVSTEYKPVHNESIFRHRNHSLIIKLFKFSASFLRNPLPSSTSSGTADRRPSVPFCRQFDFAAGTLTIFLKMSPGFFPYLRPLDYRWRIHFNKRKMFLAITAKKSPSLTTSRAKGKTDAHINVVLARSLAPAPASSVKRVWTAIVRG